MAPTAGTARRAPRTTWPTRKAGKLKTQFLFAKIQYAPPADVEALFKKTLGSLPDDFAGRRWRGYLHLYWGKPQEALRTFTWRFDNAPLQQKTIDEAIDDVIVGLKAYVGHTLAGEQFMDYQKYGPEGQDGKKGTPDDPRNPLDGLFENE